MKTNPSREHERTDCPKGVERSAFLLTSNSYLLTPGFTWASRARGDLEEALWRVLTEPETGRRKKARIAYALELWIAHLALLDRALALAPISLRELRSEELDGLLALRAARDRFQREYHPCAECGAPVKGKICTRCGAVS